ncbi:ferritin-like domain-containing protein [Parasulfuritortus cantonensis]|uniref:Ferritin-like domain-containing protein n=1 Tax=Parasulfuritortus cantonensis TaxID=2528202 RepID=A0A4R1BGL9_9PROT|nr:ferritin-like domain-containing protein [Parasulfuritortus cantonensis]TCJ16343.1 ferritin-like domain-containing protein [Parasulfuritortus cantonensis]
MNLQCAVRAVLAETDVDAKLAGADRLWADWQAGRLDPVATQRADPMLVEAGRPPRPELLPARAMPRRELSGPAGHRALIHALCHIEFTAINLALDAAYRFPGMAAAFYADWLQIAAEEALHFRLLRDHLRHLGGDYGDLPAHGGLWETAMATAHDPLARMAVVPRYFEARGLDVTPGIQAKLRGYGDAAGAAILDVILRDEVGHVAAGDRWFRRLCGERGLVPAQEWPRLIAAAGLPAPRGPFNAEARARAGFPVTELAPTGAN